MTEIKNDEEQTQQVSGLLEFIVAMHNTLVESYLEDGQDQGAVVLDVSKVESVIFSLRSVASALAESQGIPLGEGTPPEEVRPDHSHHEGCGCEHE